MAAKVKPADRRLFALLFRPNIVTRLRVDAKYVVHGERNRTPYTVFAVAYDRTSYRSRSPVTRAATGDGRCCRLHARFPSAAQWLGPSDPRASGNVHPASLGLVRTRQGRMPTTVG